MLLLINELMLSAIYQFVTRFIILFHLLLLVSRSEMTCSAPFNGLQLNETFIMSKYDIDSIKQIV